MQRFSSEDFPAYETVLCIVFVLLAAAGGLAAGEVQWHPDANMDSQLFPSLLIATATQRPNDKEEENEPDPELLGDPYGSVGVSIPSPAPDESAGDITRKRRS